MLEDSMALSTGSVFIKKGNLSPKELKVKIHQTRQQVGEKKNTTRTQKAGMKLEISPFPVPAQC